MTVALKNLYFFLGFDKVCSLADWLKLAGDVALFRAGGAHAMPAESWGRVDCPVAFYQEYGPMSFVGKPAEDTISFPHRLPDANQNIKHVDFVFNVRNSHIMSKRDTASVIGCHTMGRMYQDFSGFAGFWNNHPERLDNEYWIDMWKLRWVRDKVIGYDEQENGRIMWIRSQDRPIGDSQDWKTYVHSFLHTDMAMVFDVTDFIEEPNPDPDVWCGKCDLASSTECGADCTAHLPNSPYYEYAVAGQKYADSNDQWISDLLHGWTKMSGMGSATMCNPDPNGYGCFPPLRWTNGAQVYVVELPYGQTSRPEHHAPTPIFIMPEP